MIGRTATEVGKRNARVFAALAGRQVGFPRKDDASRRPTIDSSRAPTSSFASGMMLGRYRLVERIPAVAEWARSGEARCEFRSRGRDQDSRNRAFDDSASRERFRREAHVLSSGLMHPGVATIYDFDIVQTASRLSSWSYVPAARSKREWTRSTSDRRGDPHRRVVADALEHAHTSGLLAPRLEAGQHRAHAERSAEDSRLRARAAARRAEIHGRAHAGRHDSRFASVHGARAALR